MNTYVELNDENLSSEDFEITDEYITEQPIAEIDSKKKVCDNMLDINSIKIKKFSDKPELSFYDIFEFMKTTLENNAELASFDKIAVIGYNFQRINKLNPSTYKFFDIINVPLFFNNLFKYYTVPTSAYSSETFQGNNWHNFYPVISFKKDLILVMTSDNEGVILYNNDDEKNPDSMLHTLLGLLKSCKAPKIAENKIYIVYRTNHGFDKMGFDIKKTKIDLNENYNDGFTKISEKIVNGLNQKDKTHLVILHGIMGSGKSTFLRYLTSKVKKNIIFISPDMVNSITDPAFIPFLMKNNNSILVIEDAERALEKRSTTSQNSSVSNILNLTDGLLSDCLNISIIATFNTKTENIDEALLRKGRLLMNYKFEKLSVEKSKSLLQKLGHEHVEIKEPMTLADIYYYGTDNNLEIKERKIGFSN